VRRDDGFVTVAVIGLAALLLGVAALLATLGTVAVARHRAAAAADLAALAGARHLLDGTSCTAAARVAQAQSGELQTCVVDSTSVTVEVGVRVGSLGVARARARAGPSTGGERGNGSVL
jgi:secretion/DNA translocation related TadE-like protein